MTTKEKNNCVTQDKTVIEKIVCNLTLFDDDLMSRVFDQNIEATELLLRIVLERNIKVTSVTGQDELKNPKVGGRDIILDVHALDENGEEIKFNSMVDAANYMVDRGWKFQQAYSSAYGGKPIIHWIYYKDAENMDKA